MTFWRPHPEGVSIAVRVQPRARRTGIQGVVDSADGKRLRIAVNEPPEDGKANKAVRVELAKAIGVPQGAIRIVSGETSREKTLVVSGDPAVIIAHFENMI
jgi:uncharacterized protein (TIGR00251 family)